MEPLTEAQAREQLDGAIFSPYWTPFRSAAIKYRVPLSYLLAVASRETNLRNVLGDRGHGRSIVQIDDRAHPEFVARFPDYNKHVSEYIHFGALLLADLIQWAREHQLAGDRWGILKVAASAYNCGQEKARLGHAKGDSDRYTTGKNYGSDVLERKKLFADLLRRKGIPDNGS